MKLIERLLKGQAKLAKTVDLDDRLHLGFLGRVQFPETMTDVDSNMLENVKMVKIVQFYTILIIIVLFLYVSLVAMMFFSCPRRFNSAMHNRISVPLSFDCSLW